MSKKEKALAKIRQNPKHVRFEELESVLLRLGFKKRQDGTSHSIFTFGKHILNIPKRKPFVKRVYVELFLQVLDEIKELDEPEKKSKKP
ncbi:MAG: toxin HicA [Anaerolineae bacterium]|nr:toxin HicA [Anaerolineae bacterium]MCI0608991.1 toxin HicA [Anaerolineae bacterium]